MKNAPVEKPAPVATVETVLVPARTAPAIPRVLVAEESLPYRRVIREALMAFHRGVVLAWPTEREAYWRGLLAKVAPRFEALRLRLPREVLFINTDGRESANAPYTRAHAVVLPDLQRGDLLAIQHAGAYGFVMSSNYNTRPRAAEVMLHGQGWRIIRPRETFESLVAGEL